MKLMKEQKPIIEQLAGATILKDTGWQLTYHSPRGITDYVRYIEFDKDVSDEGKFSLCKYLNEEKLGNFGVLAYSKEDLKVVKFMTTYDSSD